MAYKQNLVNHVMLALDGSLSMSHLEDTVIAVADGLVQDLATLSQRMEQETRVSIYLFGSEVRCLVWDMDVLRLPSIRSLYRINGNTALCAATLLGIWDHREIPTKYGDHAFLGFVLTDGEENWSKHQSMHSLRDAEREMPRMLASLDDNWTFAALVPDTKGVMFAKAFGFPAGNIDKWDTSSRRGLEDAGRRVGSATERWMTGRASGVRGTQNVFDTSAARVNDATVKANLEPIDPSSFRLLPTDGTLQMDEICERAGLAYVKGNCYYPLIRATDIQDYKKIIVVEKDTERAFTGNAARDLIGLAAEGSGVTEHVVPKRNDRFTVYVQSTAPNRKPKGRALVMLQPISV